VSTDADCALRIDDVARGRIRAHQPFTFTVPAGERRIQCDSTEISGLRVSETRRPADGDKVVVALQLAAEVAQRGKGAGSLPGTEFRDCADCPQMVWLPTGSYLMGSPDSEAGRDIGEGPQHRVSIHYPLAVAKYELTRGEFRAFVNDTGRSVGECQYWDGATFRPDTGFSWTNRPEQTTDRFPVVCIDWHDAQAYARWLSQRTGKNYRLLTEAEWEYAARGGTATARPWGESDQQQCRYANGADAAGKRARVSWTEWNVCDDGYSDTAPVGSFLPNAFGLFDMIGNPWEWTQDCYSGYDAAAQAVHASGGAITAGDCTSRVTRGGGWNDYPRWLRSAFRDSIPASDRHDGLGVRLARTHP
jgi:formylglycine-generating enzyme required for sulfatase activity